MNTWAVNEVVPRPSASASPAAQRDCASYSVLGFSRR
eukprot:CAMPEP_0115889674 /NCGR_PEP_ID=MMETSP0287-20121206/32945_1 /TAXON_ID=412157 /ORGANISM="Chrysochromulina rotalis, Strain UIO044" /LENGTH=36 /DNA_ID= /DNA_START= /DNA_END= /DNA_ORIENTATION=